jgi:hypothetical protein
MLILDTIAALTLAFSISPGQGPRQPAAPPPADPKALALAQRTAQPPVIDGRSDDDIWRTAPKISDFRQFQPTESADPSFRTEFQVSYDDKNLYIMVRAYDPHPDSIMHALTRRDVRGPSDQIVVFIDSYNDKRTGYNFDVNPDGVKRDYANYDDTNEDDSWNGIWDVGTLVDSLGWTAEYRIPLSQLRYADAPSHTFGLGVWRDIERYKERVSWPEYLPSRRGLMSQLGQLSGLNGLASPRRLELTPYTVAKSISRERDSGGFDRAQKLTLGGDLKYGITNAATLDVTVNPDFGQVEADPANLNLTAFETFLRERRPFFVEGTGLYRFNINCYAVNDCGTNEGLFYSRRIGRSPYLRDDYGDASTPTATPIAAAAKLTGRTRNGLSFGLIDAVTQRVEGISAQTVEPRTNYAVLRAQQDLRNGQAGLSWIATAVNRSLDNLTEPALHKDAYATGASFRNRFGGGQYEVSGSITASRVAGTPAALVETQRNAVHYYQQPGKSFRLDSARTKLTGHAEQIVFGKHGGGITRFETSFQRQSAGFEVNDLGYLRRADQQNWSTWAALSFKKPRGIYNWVQINGNHWETWNTAGLRLENAFNFNGHIGLKNNWNLHAGGTLGTLGNSYCDRCSRGGPALRVSRALHPWFGVNGDSRKKIVPSMWVNLSYSDEGRSRSVSLNPSVQVKASTRLQANIGINIDHDDNHSQWYDNFTDDATGVTHYTFAHLEQKTLSMTLRLNYTAKPNLTFELYGEPFVSSGAYSDIRELSATPDASAYEARFVRYVPPADSDTGFEFNQLRSTAVMRWEYRPGSTLFLVWTHGREAEEDRQSDRTWRTEYRDLFKLRPDNTFLIKVAYWLNR